MGHGDEEGNPLVNSYPETNGVRKPGYVLSRNTTGVETPLSLVRLCRSDLWGRYINTQG
jgi:hypothetical protein